MELYTGMKLDAATPNAAQITGVDEVKPMTDLPLTINQLAAENRAIMYRLWSQSDSEQAKALALWIATTLGIEVIHRHSRTFARQSTSCARSKTQAR